MNKFTFDKYNRNETVRITGVVPAALDLGDIIYVDTAGLPQLLGDTAGVLNTYLVAEKAKLNAAYVVAYPIKHTDRLVGRAISNIRKGLDINGEGCGLDAVATQKITVDATNEYFQIFETDLNEKLILNIGVPADLTVVTGGAALAAGDKFSLDTASKTTKTLGAVVYVAADAYLSGTTVSTEVYSFPVVFGLKA